MKAKLLALLMLLALIAAACTAAPAGDADAGDTDAVASDASGASDEADTDGDAASGDMSFDGTTIEVLTFTGPQIAEPLQRRGAEFSEMTGAQVNVTVVPFSELYQRILTDMATGTNSFDVYVFAPQWMVDYVEPGYLEDITSRVDGDEDLQWDDVAPFFREFSSTYQGSTYTIPLDGDFQMVYYRTDILEELGMEPPQTWDDYLAIAEAADGMDMNGDGEGDYGSCIAKKRGAQSYWMITSVASAYLQSQGTEQGAFFTTDEFAPLYNNEAFARALEIYEATTEFGPPDELNLDVGDTRGLYVSGRCMLSIDWGDIGTLAFDPDQSVVQNQVGAVILPGSGEVLNRETMALEACTDELCPYADENGINRAPFAAFGGWSGAINIEADDAVKEAAYEYLAYVNKPEQSNTDVTIGATGFNPYRESQFTDTTLWEESGMSEEAASLYLGAIQESLNSPNMVLDLRVPQNQRYQQVVLDTAISQFLAGELSLEETMQTIEDGWREVTEELGRETQLGAYISTLGIENEAE